MTDFAIHSKRVLSDNTVSAATVLISNGKITEVIKGDAPTLSCTIIDAGDSVLMAGIIDPHVHINEPGRTEWEGFETATRAAVAGGITTLVEMPLNASPVTTTVAAFEQKLVAAKGKLYTDCGFWGGIIPGNAGEIEPLIAKGVLGFKAFLTHSGIDEFPNVTETDLHLAMPLIAKYGLPLLVHCELTDDAASKQEDPSSYREYLASRPRQWEDAAIALMIRLCEQYQCRVHIVHVSSADAIDMIAKAKEKGLPLTAETAQHYLYFNAEEIPDGSTAFKCAPPIRERSNNERLWQALKEGVIDFVATDHSPAPPELKQIGSGDFVKAWGGIASLQFALPVLWSAAKKHEAGMTDMAQWLCCKPALLASLHGRKGKIEKGFDADLVIWNPEASFVVNEDNICHRHKVTPYIGETLFGIVEQTYLGGEKVFDKGMFTALHKGKTITR